MPLQQFVLKMHSRCNLACSYCYVYQMADQGWHAQPPAMAGRTIRQAALRIGEHAAQHKLTSVRVIFHGGEPLLAGARNLAEATVAIRAAIPGGTDLTASVQTNGTLLDTECLEILLTHGIRVGVSLDGGTAATHDRHRRAPDGQGSFQWVHRGLQALQERRYRHLFAGVLCTVDLRNDPIPTYESMLAFAPPAIDFLLPLGNWTSPPPGLHASDPARTPYADWLIALFDRWYASGTNEPGIRLFEEIIGLIIGDTSRTEVIGLTPSTLVVVDTDGALTQVDTLKSAYDGACDLGLDVFSASFDDVLATPPMAARQAGLDGLCGDCLRCEVVQVCGGGYHPHRYRAETGFRNPSVYCADLRKLIHHVGSRVRADVDAILENQACKSTPSR